MIHVVPGFIFINIWVVILRFETRMYLVESKGGAIACMLLALLFLGTWPALITLLERRGRLPQHTYLDYTITNLLAAILIAFTLGQIGHSSLDKPNFLDQLSQVPLLVLIKRCLLERLGELFMLMCQCLPCNLCLDVPLCVFVSFKTTLIEINLRCIVNLWQI